MHPMHSILLTLLVFIILAVAEFAADIQSLNLGLLGNNYESRSI